jgi:uncharacterized membrane protein YkoI
LISHQVLILPLYNKSKHELGRGDLVKKRKWVYTAGGILVLGLLIFIGFQWLAPSLSAQTLTEKEANKVAIEKYPGEIISTTKTNGQYQVEMKLETGVYHIKIDEESGDVLAIIRQEGTNESPVNEGGETPEESQPKQLTQKEIEARISSQGDLQSIEFVEGKNSSYYQAVVSKNNEKFTLKLDPYTGEILESNPVKEPASVISEREAIDIAEKHLKGSADDADFYQPPNQTPYYLIDVELDDGSEKVVQVDAYTKQVKSVTDDDLDEDDEDDNGDDQDDDD